MDPFGPNPNPRGGAMGGPSAAEVHQERGCRTKGVSQQATNPKLERDRATVVAALSGPTSKAPGSAGGYLPLPLIDVGRLSPDSQEIIGKRIGSKRMARVCHFLRHIEQFIEAEGLDEKIGDVCTEEEIQAIWRASRAIEPA